MNNNSLIIAALNHLHVKDLSRRDWIRVGMALKEEGFNLEVWDEWSKDDDRYHEGECEREWRTFRTERPDAANGGTIVGLAKDFGFDPRTAFERTITLENFRAFPKDTVMQTLLSGPHMEPSDELIQYLETVFRPGDIVPYATRSHMGEDGKWHPGKAQFADRDELIEKLWANDDLKPGIGSYVQSAGAWIGFNPTDGEGMTAEHITDFRHALVECDTIPIPQQLTRYRQLELPIVALTHSGSRSLHAIVSIDAVNAEEYRSRVAFLYAYLRGVYLPLDEANKNPNRWTRMPGAIRGNARQWLVATDLGADDYYDWVIKTAFLD